MSGTLNLLQVVSWPGHNAVVISLHEGIENLDDAKLLGNIVLDEDSWEEFKQAGDDAMAISTGRAAPRDPDDPDFYRGLPTQRADT